MYFDYLINSHIVFKKHHLNYSNLGSIDLVTNWKIRFEHYQNSSGLYHLSYPSVLSMDWHLIWAACWEIHWVLLNCSTVETHSKRSDVESEGLRLHLRSSLMKSGLLLLKFFAFYKIWLWNWLDYSNMFSFLYYYLVMWYEIVLVDTCELGQ